MQFLGQRLQAGGDLGDLLHAVLARLGRGALHQLHVVDDDHVQPALALQAARAGGQLRDRDAAGLVDEQRRLLHHLRAGDELLEVGLGDFAAADLRRRDFRLLGDDAGGELFGRHFEREEADHAAPFRLVGAVRLLRGLVGGRDVEGDVGGERRLAHGRPAGQDDQIRRLQAAKLPVDVAQAGRDAGQVAVAHVGGVGHVDGRRHRVGEGLEAAIVAPGLGQLEEPPLGVLDLLGRRHVDRRVIGDVDHVLADGDQRAPRREVVDRPAIVGRVDDRHGLGREAGEIVRDRHVADLPVGRQEGLHRDGIGRFAHADKLAGDLEDLAVQGLVEMRRLQEIRDAVESVVIDQDRAEQRLLGLDVVGCFAIERRLRHAELADCFCHCRPVWSLPANGLSDVGGAWAGNHTHSPKSTAVHTQGADAGQTAVIPVDANRNARLAGGALEQNRKIRCRPPPPHGRPLVSPYWPGSETDFPRVAPIACPGSARSRSR